MGTASLRAIVSMARSWSSVRTGANPNPQLPMTTEVTPCQPENGAVRVPVHLRVVVRVQVDEAGRHDEPLGIEDARPLLVVDAPDRGDQPVLDADVGAEARRAQPVDHGAAADDGVEHGEVASRGLPANDPPREGARSAVP